MSGNILEIYKYGSSVLRKPTEIIGDVTPEIRQLVEDMYVTMYDDDGAGLSANQVGVSLNLCVIGKDLGEEPRAHFPMLNVEILEQEGKETEQEGCLSIPGIREPVSRATKIKVRYQDLELNTLEEEFTGFYARVIQHELDHLKGVLFIDRISPVRRSLLKRRLSAIAETQKHHR
jgi:peptide deformylase